MMVIIAVIHRHHIQKSQDLNIFSLQIVLTYILKFRVSDSFKQIIVNISYINLIMIYDNENNDIDYLEFQISFFLYLFFQYF